MKKVASLQQNIKQLMEILFYIFNFYFILNFRLKDDFLTKGKLNVSHLTIFLSVIRQSV